MSEPLILVLQPDNPSNTKITDKDTGELVYTVHTEHEKETITYVKDAEGKILAQWEWHDTRSDIVTLGNAKPMPSSVWLRKSLIPFNSSVSFKDDKARSFKWKGVEGGGQMELYSSEEKNHPIAAFSKSLRYTDRKVNPPAQVFRDATLTLGTRAQEITNLVVISFLMLEKTRRMKETSQGSVASALAVQMVDTR
ncbi:hypothetical protein M413DRAFT_445923 [Hebeloma cylindrosporum]|uniref:DUF6593 domain-containing protein n=1 Tax=Hebeloma cylindrosporum TaxID=76867 RepID=A0A0C3CA40_HEBCY|nr:hypothetical protein M413DRAFT_445923 [Hebeloma cylindrosporum h7]